MPQVKEGQIRFVALQLLAQSPDGFLTTSRLIEGLERHFRPQGKDAMIAMNRNDIYFSQKVRNLVSHRDRETSLESRGYAVYIENREGWRVTDEGREFVISTARI